MNKPDEFEEFEIKNNDDNLKEKYRLFDALKNEDVEERFLEHILNKNQEKLNPNLFWARKSRTLAFILLGSSFIYLTLLLYLGNIYVQQGWQAITGGIFGTAGFLWKMITQINF